MYNDVIIENADIVYCGCVRHVTWENEMDMECQYQYLMERQRFVTLRSIHSRRRHQRIVSQIVICNDTTCEKYKHGTRSAKIELNGTNKNRTMTTARINVEFVPVINKIEK